MILDIIKYTGDKIRSLNDWVEGHAVNVIQLNNGLVVNFIGEEKEYQGISDDRGNYFYLRIDPNIIYNKLRAITSSKIEYEQSVKLKFVFYTVNDIENKNPVAITELFLSQLMNINYAGYLGEEQGIKLEIKGSNADYFSNFKTELKKDFEYVAFTNVISIDLILKCRTMNICDCLPTGSFIQCIPEVNNNCNNNNNNNDCCDNVVSDKYYREDFASAISFSILGSQHQFNRVPNIEIFDTIGQKVFAKTTIDLNNYNITITFNRLQTGTVILT